MRYDTAGNPIKEPLDGCDCGLTGGCEKCNPDLFGFKIKTKIWLKENEWGFLPPKTIEIDKVIDMLREIEKQAIPSDVDIPDDFIWEIAMRYKIKP